MSDMILPASCTADCARERRRIKFNKSDRKTQVICRRRYRRTLEVVTRKLACDPSLFDGEPFNVKLYTGWDIS